MKISNLFFGILFIFSVRAFDTNQLPLSDKIKESFPKLNASCFIIANLDCYMIINELNSDKRIHTGTFDDILGESKLNLEHYTLKKQENSLLGNNKLTLFEMNDILAYILTHSLYHLQSYNSNLTVSIIKSAMSGYGCVFHYQYKGEYIGILYGCNSQEEVLDDIKKLTYWLNQFYVQDISDLNQNFIEIPLLYGKEKTIKLAQQKQKILMSKFISGKIERTYHYKTISKAPVRKDDVLGTVFFSYELFKNPVSMPLVATKSIKKSNIFNRIIDTIQYIIFGANNSKSKDPFQNTLE